MKNKIMRKTIAIIMTLGMLLGSVSGNVTPVFATGEDDAIVTEVSTEETQAPTEPEAPQTVVETEAVSAQTPSAPAEEPTAPSTIIIEEEPTAEETTEAETETPTEETTAPAETTTAPAETTTAPAETTTAPEETKEKTVKELTWDGGTVKITVSRKDGAEIPESSTLKVETLNDMNKSKSQEEELNIIKSFFDPALDKVAAEYGLYKNSDAYEAVIAGMHPFAVSIKDKNGKETTPEMNIKIEVKDSANQMYDLVFNEKIREIRVAEFDAYKNATLLGSDRASVSFDTAKGTYNATAKTDTTYKYVVILYLDTEKVKEAQKDPAAQKQEEEQEEEEEEPESIKLTQTASDGTVVTAVAQPGALPADAKMRVTSVDVFNAAVTVLTQNGFEYNAAVQSVQKLVENGEDLSNYVAAYNISFYLPDDPEKEIEPTGTVEVTFEKVSLEADDPNQIEAYHVSDDESVDPIGVEAAGVDGEITATMVTDSFSDFIISNDTGLLGALMLLEASEGYASAEEMAADIYGGSNPKITMHAKLEGGNQNVLAGQNDVELTLTLNTVEALAFDYQMYGSLQLYDTYDNVKVKITMPAGLTIEVPTGGMGAYVDHVDHEDGSQVWEIYFKTITAKTSQEPTATFNLKVGNNGYAGVGDVIPLHEVGIEVTGTFQIDTYSSSSTTPDPGGTIYPVKADIQAVPGDLTIVSNDLWAVEKSVDTRTGHTSGYKVSEDKTKVTVYFKVIVGLDKGTFDNPTGLVATNNATYTRIGRVPLSSVQLKDILDQVIAHDDSTIEPNSIYIYKDGGTPVEINSNTPFDLSDELALNTIGSNTAGISSDNVDQNCPVITTYFVEVEYPYSKFISEYYDSDQSKLDVDNTAQLNYKRKGENTERQDTGEASVSIGEITIPGALNVTKYIEKYNSTANPYLATSANGFSGEYKFTVWKADGTTAATLYTAPQSGSTQYQSYSGNTITIKPDTGTTDTYYLDPGTYIVKEITTGTDTWVTIPNTYVENGIEQEINNNVDSNGKPVPVTFTFTNKEKLGEFKVHKVDEGNKDLSGATIKVYTTEDCTEIAKDAAGNDLTVTMSGANYTFTRLKPGDYWVKETAAPSNSYVIDSTPHKVTVPENYDSENVAEITITNVKNQANLNLSKLISTVTTQYRAVWSTYVNEFNNKFEIQKSEDNGTTWEKVETIGSLTARNYDGSGSQINYTKALPVYVYNDGVQGNAIQYRIVETVPDGWYPTDSSYTYDATAGTVTSSAVTLTTTNDSGYTVASDKTITFHDRKYDTVKITKKFFKLNSEGNMAEDTAATEQVTVTLYQKIGSGSYTQVAVSSESSKTNPATFTGTYTWDYLKRFTDDGTAIDYFVKEADIQGYALTTAANSDGYVAVTRPSSSFEQTATLTNVQQKIAVRIVKKDANTGNFVGGAVVSVIQKNSSDTTVATKLYDPSTGNETTSTGIAIVETGNIFWVEPGYKYTVTETTVPDNYSFASATTVDLTGITPVPYDQQIVEIVVTNQSDPSLKIKKTLTYTDQNGTLHHDETSAAEFDLYYKDTNGNIVPYMTGNPATQVHITGTTPVQIKKGEYYVHETNASAIGAIDPDQHPEVYGYGTTSSKVVKLDTSSGSIYLFGPINVDIQTGTENVFVFPVDNIKNSGNVTVIKKNWRTKAIMSNALIGIRETSASEVPTGDRYRKYSKAGTGEVTFYDFPVYDSDGNLISYTITELAAPTGYYQYNDDLVTTLVAGETITTLNGAAQTTNPDNTLIIYNDKLVGFNVAKDYFNAWEYQTTHKAYALANTTVAIYKKLADGSYELVTFTDAQGQTYNTVKTLANGAVKVTGLYPDETYVAVEVSVPDVEEYQYLHPTSNAPGSATYDTKLYLSNPPPATLSEAQLGNYNYVKRDPISSTATEAEVEAWEDEVHKLHNVEDWAQIDVTKYKAHFDKNADGSVNMDSATGKTTSDHAIFRLYKQVIDPANVVSPLTFNANNCELIDEYTSGTYYDDDNNRVPGRFATDILNCDPTLVYWLVEVMPEPGTGMITNPNQTVTLYVHPDFYVDGELTLKNADGRSQSYLRNYVKYDEIMNIVGEGPGPGALRYASIRVAKWAAIPSGYAYNPNRYEPLGNVTFNIYLCDENGVIKTGSDGKPVVIDVITVGLDEAGYAAGQSADFRMTTDRETGKVDSFYVGTQALDTSLIQVETDGGHTNYFFYVAIREASAPAEFTYDEDYYYEKVYFLGGVTGELGEWTFNDAYFVINANKGSETLAADTQGENQVNAHLGDGVSGPYSYSTSEADYNRIINYPVVKSPVVVRKYGYVVNEDNVGMTSEQLDNYYTTETTVGRTKLAGIELHIEKWDEKTEGWIDYDYNESIENVQSYFETDDNGSFRFVGGLETGRYRISENSLGDYEASFENAYRGSQDHYRYFTVKANTSQMITLYNPAKATVKVLKKNGNGTTTLTPSGEDSIFALTNTDAQGTAPEGEWSNTNKTTYFNNVNTGTYQLTEPNAPTGYTAAYLQTYFHTAYASDNPLYTFADSEGTWFGNLITEENHEDDDYDYGTIVSEYYSAAETAITVIDPLKVNLKIKKTDDNTASPKNLEGAKFTVYRQNFDKTSGAVAPDDSKWEMVTGSPFTTDSNGEIDVDELKNMVPGFYKIVETQVPEGYELIGRQDTWTVALTGGLNVTVSGTNLTTDTDATAEYTFKNREKAGIGVKKTFTENALTQDFDWSAEFLLGTYDAATNTMTTIDRVTLDQDDPDKNFNVELSQGSDYYITESANSAYSFSSFNVAGATITDTAEVSGVTWYKFTVTSAEDLTVTAENITLYTEIEIEKRDKDLSTKLLHGAEFKLVKVVGEAEIEVANAVWTELTDEGGEPIGKYVVSFLMDSADPATYRIYETEPPAGYLLDTTQYVEVPNVKPGEHRTTDGFYFPDGTEANKVTISSDAAGNNKVFYFLDEGGFTIKLKKLSNIYGSEVLNPVSGAKFALVRWENGAWIKFDEKSTGTDGYVSFLAQNGAVYGLVETVVPNGYSELESIHVVTLNENNEVVSEEALPVHNTPYNDDYKVYLLNGGSSDWTVGLTYLFNGYNVPKVGFQVRKEDVSDSGILPIATYNVYQVEGNITGDALTETIVDQIYNGTYEGASLIYENQVTDQGRSGNDYSFRNVTGVTSGYTYVVIETSVAAFESGKVYDSLAKDDNRVKWYGSIYIPVGATTDYSTMYVMLDNVLGRAQVDLTKTAAEPTTDRQSLFKGSQQVTYTVTPTVTNSIGLETFTVEDTGLTAYHVVDTAQSPVYDTDTDGNDTPDEFRGYCIDKVTVTEPTHDPTVYGVADAPIEVTVTFYDFDGAVIGEPQILNSTNGWSCNKPSGEDAKRVTLSYAAPALSSKGYATGLTFNPGAITINATIKKQKDGATVNTIDKIHNEANTILEYRPYDANGVKPTGDPLSDDASAYADITFKQDPIPVVALYKTAVGDTPEADATATLDSLFYYTIKIENYTEGVPLKDPFILDMIPKGTEFISAQLTTANSNLELISTNHFIQGELADADSMTVEKFNFSGYLEYGKAETLEVCVKLHKEVELFGTTIKNYAFMSSSEPTYKCTDNPTGAPFRDNKDVNTYADTLPNVGITLDPSLDPLVAKAMQKLIGGFGDYGYVGDSKSNPWNSDTNIDLVKTIRADQDIDSSGHLLDFSTTRLAQASNGAAPGFENGGWVEYQLAITNTDDHLNRTSICIADILPQPGDTQDAEGHSRSSSWKVTFNQIESVTNGTLGDVPSEHYKVYAYKGPVEEAYLAINAALAHWQSSNNFANPGFDDTKWELINPKQADSDITAILFITDQSGYGTIGQNQSMVITMKTDVIYYDDTAFPGVAYQNNTNNFRSVVYNVKGSNAPTPSGTLGSNPVSATLMPEEVQVGGNIWIDADNDGVQDDGDFSEYTNDAIVKLLMNDVTVNLNTYNNKVVGRTYTGGIVTPGFVYDNSEGNCVDGPGTAIEEDHVFVGEPEFLFQHLKAGLMTGNKPYVGDGAFKDLNVVNLKGTAPSTYIIDVNISGEATSIWNLAKHAYNLYYQSDDPEAMPAAAETDSNFDVRTFNGTGFYNERFYLYSSSRGEDTDMTKDIGFVPFREFWLKKVSSEDHDMALEGAEFEVYGPYKRNTVTAENYNPSILNGKKINTLKTDFEIDDEGWVVQTGLLWYMEYIIVETGAPDSFALAGEVVETEDGTVIEKLADNTWILRVPASPSTDNSHDIVIADPPAQWHAEVEKLMTGEPTIQDLSFTFKMTATEVETGGSYYWDNTNDPATKTIITEGSSLPNVVIEVPAGTSAGSTTGIFDEISFIKAGTYKFTIEEVKPASTVPGVTYASGKAVVTITVPGTNGAPKDVSVEVTPQGATDVTAEVKDDDQLTVSAKFTNTYTPEHWQAKVDKAMTGEPTTEDKEFTFKMTATEVETDGSYWMDESNRTFITKDYYWTRTINVTAGSTSGDTTELFDQITFIKPGDYVFKIEEVKPNPALEGVTYADDYVTVTVKVSATDTGALTKTVTTVVTRVGENDLEVTKGTDALVTVTAKFTNKFTPEHWQAKVQKLMSANSQTLKEAKTFTFKMTATSVITNGSFWMNNGTNTVIETNKEWTRTIEVPLGSTGVYESVIKAFDEITFTKKGDYVFKIEEVKDNPAIPGMTYADDYVTVTVNVSATATGALTKTVTVAETTNGTDDLDVTKDTDALVTVTAKFTNEYVPSPTEWPLQVKKILTGEPLYDAANTKFIFTLTYETGSHDGETDKGYRLPDPSQITITGKQVEDGGGSAIAWFGDITFTKAGTYYFKIIEEPKAENTYPRVTFDNTKWQIEIKVDDDNNGNLVVTKAEYTNDKDSRKFEAVGPDGKPLETVAAEFSNDYTPEKVSWFPYVKKIMDKVNGEPTVKDKTFTFTMEATKVEPAGGCYWLNGSTEEIIVEGTTEWSQTVTVPAGQFVGGPEAFDNITFTKEGTYKFTITEDVPADADKLPGVTYTTAPVEFTLEIEDNAEGELYIKSLTYTGDVEVNDQDETIVTAKYTNVYVPEPTYWQAEVQKLLKDSEPTTVDKTFTFELKATEFIKDGSYRMNGDTAEVITDTNNAWTQEITVPAGSTYRADDESVDYTSVFKKFDQIKFTKSGTYKYTISELVDDPVLDGIIYTGDVVEVIVEVVDKDGYLAKTVTAKVTGSGKPAPATYSINKTGETPDLVTVSVSFTNKYEVKPVYYTPPVLKNVTVDFGPTVAEKIFYFDLTLESAENVVNGKTIQVWNGCSIHKDGDKDSVTIVVQKGQTTGNASFKQLQFSKAGTYKFLIEEQIPTGTDAEEGITYTTVKWNMTVVITDTNTGTPSALEITSVKYAKVASQQSKTPQQAADDGDDIKSVQIPAEKAEEAEGETDVTEAPKAEGDGAEGDVTEAEATIDDDEVKELIGIEEYVFINDYKPEPVKWIPMVQKILSDDSNDTKINRTFDFEFKRITAASGGNDEPGEDKDAAEEKVEEKAEEVVEDAKKVPADVKAKSDGCDLSADTTLYAQALLKAHTKKSDPVNFYPSKDNTGVPTGDPVTITFDMAGTYYFEVTEVLPDPTDPEAIKKLYPGFTYDVEPKSVEVKVTDIDGQLIIESVKVDGVIIYEVKVTEVTDPDTGRITFTVEPVVTPEKPEGYSENSEDGIVISTVKVTNTYYLGKVAIYKRLADHEDVDEDLQNGTERIQDPTTFVFSVEVEWSYPGYTGTVNVYSNVVSQVFTEAGEQLVAEIEDLPVGSVVTVKEIYTGGNYDLTSDETVNVNVIRDDPLTPEEEKEIANFDNAHNGNWKDGGSVTNIIDSDGEIEEVHYSVDGPFTVSGGGNAEPEPQEAK